MPLYVEGRDLKLAQDSMEQLCEDLRQRKALVKTLSIKRLASRYKVSEATVKRMQRKLDESDAPATARSAK